MSAACTGFIVEMPALLWFALVVFALTITPGPGVIYVTARAASQGRLAGFASAFGIESGEVLWLVAAATGIGALLAASPDAFTFLRLAGAAYLVFLGIQRWRHAEKVEVPAPASLGRLFAQGVVTQVLNPKVMVFFVAFLPQFLDPSRAIGPQVAVLGVVYVAVAVAVDTAYVLASTAVARRLLSSRTAQRRTAQASAATYVALGVITAVEGGARA
jgi:threonine/homoserine/homoserine lactone efflux protein